MTTSMGHLRSICVALVAFSSALSAEELTLDLEPAKTQIIFVVRDVLHTVRGSFRLKEAIFF